ncbi:MAG: hypothetical protein ACI9N1_000216 [Flavobacteriales bacterium]
MVALRSQDGIKIEEIEIVEGAVNPDSQHYYEFYDYAPHYEDYYRLATVDDNGELSNSIRLS